MEKNVDENSSKDDHNETGETPIPEITEHDTTPDGETPMPEITESDIKLDGDNAGDEPLPPPPEHDGDHDDVDKKEDAVEAAEAVEAVEAEEIVESPPPSLEKVAEEIDQLLSSFQQNDGDAEKEVSFEIPDFVNKFLYLVEEKITSYETSKEGNPKWEEVLEKDRWLLENVDRISKLMKMLIPLHHQNQSSSEEGEGDGGEEIDEPKPKDLLSNRIGDIQQRVMSHLEDDFRLLLEDSRIPTELEPVEGNNNNNKGKHVASEQQQKEEVDPENNETESETNFPGYPEEAITIMSKIAAEMSAGGYQSECCQVYIMARRNAFEEILLKLGLERLSIDEMVQKLQWEILARDMIPAWMDTFHQCTAVYFPGERKLAETVFAGNLSVAAGIFGSLSRCVVIPLLNFAEGAAMTKRAGEKLFKLLDMYETLRDMIPKLDGIFPEESFEELKTEINLAKSRLAETIISILCDLEMSIKSETSKTPVPGGGVHPLTSYIMNYLNTAGDYKETLEQVFKEHSKIELSDSHNENEVVSEKEAPSPFAAQVMRVMDLLDTSLDGKAKLYRDVALSNFFMMNNGRYILQKIKRSSEMSQVIGDPWCRKKSSELRNYHKTYQRETWNKVLMCLSHEGLNVNGKVQKPVLKERFKSFNALFDEIHRTQCTWVVKDEQLQSELRVSISAVVIPAYRAFLGRFGQYLDPGRQTEKYVKYQADDIETYIDELFDGKVHQSITRRK